MIAAVASTAPRLAGSQGSAGSGSAAPDPTDPDDDDGNGSGTGSALIAPTLPAEKRVWLGERITTAISARPTLGAAKIAIAITDLATGDVVFALHADTGMNLASNAKLLTAIAALGPRGPRSSAHDQCDHGKPPCAARSAHTETLSRRTRVVRSRR